MRLTRYLCSTLVFAFVAVTPAVFADGGKLDQAGPFTGGASDSVKGVLESNGYKISLPDGQQISIWLRKGLAGNAKSDEQGALFTQLGVGSLMGVISFSKDTVDYRGHAVKAGSYTLRYALHPADGNHMGVAPNRDFLLLVPLTDDKDADAVLKFDDMVKLSAKVIGSSHPAVFSMISAEGHDKLPAVWDDSGHVVFGFNLKTTSGPEVPIGLVVKGVADQ